MFEFESESYNFLKIKIRKYSFFHFSGNFVHGYKTVFNFITSMIEAVKGNTILRELQLYFS